MKNRLLPLLSAAALLLALCACGPKELAATPPATPSVNVTPGTEIAMPPAPIDLSSLPEVPTAADGATYDAVTGVYWNGSWGVVLPEPVRSRIVIRDGFFYDKTVYAYCQAHFPELQPSAYSLFAIWEKDVESVGSMGSASPVPPCRGPDRPVTMNGKCYVYGNGFYNNTLPDDGLYPFYNETLDNWNTPKAILNTFFIDDPSQSWLAAMALEVSFVVSGARLCPDTTLSCPLEPQRTERGIFAFTQEETLLTEYYDGLTLVRNNGYLISADITGPNISLWRNIQVGSTRGEVEAAYPEAVFRADGAFYQAESDSTSPSIEFFFASDGPVERIFIKGWTAD